MTTTRLLAYIVDPGSRAHVQAQAEAIRSLAKQTAENIVRIGEALADVKGKWLKHGE